jgi:hypothetical protein
MSGGDRDRAGDDRDRAGDDRDPAGADRVTALERRSRLLLRAYPAAYRRQRGEEMISTLLETTPRGRTWPRLRDVGALAVGGMKARAPQNRRRSTAANLCTAVMVGVSLNLVASLIGNLQVIVAYLREDATARAYFWPDVLASLFVAATVLLAWTAPRIVVLASALAAAAAAFYLVLGQRDLSGHFVTQVAGPAVLVALVPRAGRPSRGWLWLIGAFVVACLLTSVAPMYGWIPRLGGPSPLELVLAMGVISIAWIGIDARLAVAISTCLTLTLVQVEAGYIAAGEGLYAPFPFLPVLAAVAASAIWLLRRQSASTVS